MTPVTEVFRQNEKDANIFAAYIFIAMTAISAILVAYFFFTTFQSQQSAQTLSLGIAVADNVFRVLVAGLIFLKKGEGKAFKYLVVLSLFITSVFFTLSYRLPMWPLYSLIIVYSIRYGSPRFTGVCGALSTIMAFGLGLALIPYGFATGFVEMNYLSLTQDTTLAVAGGYGGIYDAIANSGLIDTNAAYKEAVNELLIPVLLTAGTTVVCAFIAKYNSQLVSDLMLEAKANEDKAKDVMLGQAENLQELREREHELKKYSEALEQQRNALLVQHNIVENAGCGTWCITLPENGDPQMTVNKKMLEVMGLEGQEELTPESVYEHWQMRILEEDLAGVGASINNMLAGKTDETVHRWEHPEKGVISLRLGGLMESSSDAGRVLCGYGSDVSELSAKGNERQLELQDALKRADRVNNQLQEKLDAAHVANSAKTSFITKISREIRTPMEEVVTCSKLTESEVECTDAVRGRLTKVTATSQHLLTLTEEILDLEKLSSGQVEADEIQTHLPNMLRDLRTALAEQAEAKQIELSIDTQGVETEDVVVDNARLSRVLLNTMNNAIKYTPAGGSVSLNVAEVPYSRPGYTEFEFRIADNGVGMSEDFQKHVFSAFTREDNPAAVNEQGAGLGMAISKNIMDVLGGSISVSSEAGEGTEFVISLRCKAANEADEVVPVAELQGLNVFVAGADLSLCSNITRMLNDFGMEPDFTAFGDEAVSAIAEKLEEGTPYQICIVDWDIEDADSAELVSKIREAAGPDTRIVVLSNGDWSAIEEEARQAGADAFCAKPLFASELREVLVSE